MRWDSPAGHPAVDAQRPGREVVLDVAAHERRVRVVEGNHRTSARLAHSVERAREALLVPHIVERKMARD